MSARSIATRIVLALILVALAVACLSSIAIAAVVGMVTLAFVIVDTLRMQRPRVARAPRATLVVDLTSRRLP